MDGFLGRPSLPDDMRGERLTVVDRPPALGPEWQPAVVEALWGADDGEPALMQAFVRVAGHVLPDEIIGLTFAPFEQTHHILAGHVTDVRWAVQTAPVEIIGFGVTGMLAAGIANAADRAMSVWHIALLLDDGTAASIRLHREPDGPTLARLRARLRSPASDPATTIRTVDLPTPRPVPVATTAAAAMADTVGSAAAAARTPAAAPTETRRSRSHGSPAALAGGVKELSTTPLPKRARKHSVASVAKQAAAVIALGVVIAIGATVVFALSGGFSNF